MQIAPLIRYRTIRSTRRQSARSNPPFSGKRERGFGLNLPALHFDHRLKINSLAPGAIISPQALPGRLSFACNCRISPHFWVNVYIF